MDRYGHWISRSHLAHLKTRPDIYKVYDKNKKLLYQCFMLSNSEKDHIVYKLTPEEVEEEIRKEEESIAQLQERIALKEALIKYSISSRKIKKIIEEFEKNLEEIRS